MVANARSLSGRPESGSSFEREILGAVPVAILVVDGEDRFRFANTAAEMLLGHAEAVLQRLALSDLFGGGGSVREIVDRVRRTGGDVMAHDVDLGGRLSGRRGDLRAAPAGESGEQVILVLEECQGGGGRGLSPQSAGAARSAVGLAAMLAHEIKNPLSGIRGAAQLLEKGEDSRVGQMAALIRSEVDRIRGLVDELEHFSDTRPLARQAVNIHAVLDHVASVAANGFAAGRKIVKLYDPSLPPVLGARDRLVQIFLNLVKNAAEATNSQSGEIRLQSAYEAGIRVRNADGSRSDLPIVLSIVDNGCGITPEIADHLFEPFVTAREGGGGLGLAMVAKLVAAHGGLVEWEDAPEGQGTLFRVRLPAAEGEAVDG